VTVRAFRYADYDEVASVWNATHPNDLYTPEEFRYLDASVEPPQLFGRFVAEHQGRVVGVADYRQFSGMYHPQKFLLELYVHPELAHFDPTPYSALTERLEHQGIRLRSAADLKNSPEFARRFHALFSTLRQDVPRSEPATPFSFEAFEKSVMNAPDFYPEGTFLALDGEAFLGLTMVWRSAASATVNTGLTAVRRTYRGRGVATALKVASLSTVKANGAARVVTDNDTRNVEMIAVNDKLGFVKQPARLSMVKVIQDG
jgi:RimJ/RimL family protein N-acetyltransferase